MTFKIQFFVLTKSSSIQVTIIDSIVNHFFNEKVIEFPKE